MIETPKTVHEIGKAEIHDVYHGTYDIFEEFSDAGPGSVGFHFGDFAQATYFATRHGAGGRLIKASLIFNNLIDIGKDDWGWMDCKRGAFLCYVKFQESKIPLDTEAFVKILGQGEWSLAAFQPTDKMTKDERQAFADILRAHEFDGVRYTNNYEPPGKAGGTAYFALTGGQIKIHSIQEL